MCQVPRCWGSCAERDSEHVCSHVSQGLRAVGEGMGRAHVSNPGGRASLYGVWRRADGQMDEGGRDRCVSRWRDTWAGGGMNG